MGINEINKEIFALRLKSVAMTYRDLFSMTISPIEGRDFNGQKNSELSYKNPINSDSQDAFREYDWHCATGLGVNLGNNNVWALDIDNITTDKKEREKLISDILYLLRLPNDYKWLSKSGSGKGIHIIFKSQFINNAELDSNVLTFSSDWRKMSISMRMKGFLVLPPSLHYSGGEYEFINGPMPTYSPYYVSMDSLYALFSQFFGVRDRIYLSDENWSLYLPRTAILKEVCKVDNYYSSYDQYEYHFYDELELLKSCHNPEALNSLGCLYAKMAFDNPKDKKELLNMAKNAFKESGDDDAKNNLNALSAIQEKPELPITYPLNRYGEYAYVFLRKHKYKYLFFDTETTGLPRVYDAPYKDLENWPRLVQLSWLCVSEDGEIISQDNRYIRPVGFTIPEDAVKVHGVSTAKAVQKGDDLETVLMEFADCANYADYIVGHNVSYDVNVVCAEIYRLEGRRPVEDHSFEILEPWQIEEGYYETYDERISRLPIIDTMKSAVNYCRIPGYKGQYKYPKLQELYRLLFGKEFGGAHNSMADIKATLDCYLELNKKGIITQ